METLKTGCLGYYDCFSGLVPVKILAVTAPPVQPLFDLSHGQAKASIAVRAEVTKDHGAHKKGEMLEGSSLAFVPRGAIRRLTYSSVISPYAVEPDKTEVPELAAAP